MFTIRPSIRKKRIPLLLIGWSTSALGSVVIQISFPKPNVTFDLHFLLMKEDVPSMLSIRNMVENVLKISLEKCSVLYDDQSQLQNMESYIMIHV